MDNGQAKPERFAPCDSTLTYLWEVALKPVAVRLSVRVADEINRKAVEVVRSVSAIGSEIGGLLLGTANAGRPTLITVDDYEFIRCDHRAGPYYHAGKVERERFDRAIAARTSIGSELEVVGFFRSHTRKGLSLDADDIALCSSRFAKPHQIVLLIQPSFVRAGRAGIFIWEDGRMRGETTYREFPSSAEELVRQGLATKTPAAPVRSRPVERRPSSALPAVAEPAPDLRKRAQIVPIAVRREAEPLPLPPSPVLAEAPEPGVDRGRFRTRVGRCSEKVQLCADPRPTGGSQASEGPKGQPAPRS